MNWIDVNEKLPEVGIDSVYGSAWVLVSYVFDGKHYNTLGKYVKTSAPYWIDVHRDKLEKITHWMQLPEPPSVFGGVEDVMFGTWRHEDNFLGCSFNELFEDVANAEFVSAGTYDKKSKESVKLTEEQWEVVNGALEDYCLRLCKDGEHDYLKTVADTQKALLDELGKSNGQAVRRKHQQTTISERLYMTDKTTQAAGCLSHLTAELDTGIAMNWIDVNEKLPEVGIYSVYGSAWVLVSYVFDGKQYVGEARFIKVKQPYWKNVFGDKMINNQVTHWMPLPEPPMIGV